MLKLMVLLTLSLPVPQPKPVDPQPIVVNVPPQSVNLNLPPSKKDGWDIALVVCNILLAAVGIGGVLVALRTLKQISKQTDSIERSVQVAEMALILDNRAKVFVRGGVPSVDLQTGVKCQVYLHVVNIGATPAKVISNRLGVVIDLDGEVGSVNMLIVEPGKPIGINLDISDAVYDALRAQYLR